MELLYDKIPYLTYLYGKISNQKCSKIRIFLCKKTNKEQTKETETYTLHQYSSSFVCI